MPEFPLPRSPPSVRIRPRATQCRLPAWGACGLVRFRPDVAIHRTQLEHSPAEVFLLPIADDAEDARKLETDAYAAKLIAAMSATVD